MADVTTDILREQGASQAAQEINRSLLDDLQEHYAVVIIAFIILVHIVLLGYFGIALVKQSQKKAITRRIDMFEGLYAPVKEVKDE